MGDKSKRIALERVQILFNLAEKSVNMQQERSQKYATDARRIAMRARLGLPKEVRLLICRRCKRFIFPGVSSHVRTRSKRSPHVTITCLICGSHNRILLRKREIQRGK